VDPVELGFTVVLLLTPVPALGFVDWPAVVPPGPIELAF